MAEKKILPSIQQLALDAWDLFKKTWTAYLKLLLLVLAFIFLAVLIGILIILPISFTAVSSHFQFYKQLSPFNIAVFILFILWLVLFFISLFAIDIAFPIAGVFILQGKKTSPIFDLIKNTKPYFWSYFLVMLLSGFLVIGGMSLLVIPGLLIAFFFSFVLYEVVIDNHRGLTAFSHSYFMIKNNFWEVLGRLIVLELAIIIVSSILGRIAQGEGLLRLVQFLFSLFASWYARAYTFLLYKEVRAKTTFPAQIPMQWVWIVSGVGWAIMILGLIGLGFWFSQLPAHPSHNPIHGNAV